MRKMKKEMKELLHHILQVWTYMEIEQHEYEVRNDMTEDELQFLYSDLCEYIEKKYKLEE
tara:strand:+ start:1926 stop:2105 length:180 start_codon:yes stop_codon:yes gene_type:complete